MGHLPFFLYPGFTCIFTHRFQRSQKAKQSFPHSENQLKYSSQLNDYDEHMDCDGCLYLVCQRRHLWRDNSLKPLGSGQCWYAAHFTTWFDCLTARDNTTHKIFDCNGNMCEDCIREGLAPWPLPLPKMLRTSPGLTIRPDREGQGNANVTKDTRVCRSRFCARTLQLTTSWTGRTKGPWEEEHCGPLDWVVRNCF